MIDSIVGAGSIISGGHVERSVVGRGVRVNSHARVVDSILMDGVRVGRRAELDRCIVDKNVVVPEGMRIGFDRERDGCLFRVSRDGIVVVPKNMDLSGAG